MLVRGKGGRENLGSILSKAIHTVLLLPCHLHSLLGVLEGKEGRNGIIEQTIIFSSCIPVFLHF